MSCTAPELVSLSRWAREVKGMAEGDGSGSGAPVDQRKARGELVDHLAIFG